MNTAMLTYAVSNDGFVSEELFCPDNNVDHNANWPVNVTAGTRVEGRFCKPGWTGIVGRLCLPNGQWDFDITGECERTLGWGQRGGGWGLPSLRRTPQRRLTTATSV